jgi:hypothetical protein
MSFPMASRRLFGREAWSRIGERGESPAGDGGAFLICVLALARSRPPGLAGGQYFQPVGYPR